MVGKGYMMMKQEREGGGWSVCWHIPLTLDWWLSGASVWVSIAQPRYFEEQAAHPSQGSEGQASPPHPCGTSPLPKASARSWHPFTFSGAMASFKTLGHRYYFRIYFSIDGDMTCFQLARIHPCHDGSRLDSCPGFGLICQLNSKCLLPAVSQAASWRQVAD